MFARTVTFIVGMTIAAILTSPCRAQSIPPSGERPAQTTQVLPWYNGSLSSIGTDYACLSSPPILETRVLGYAGFTLIPPNRTPAVGEVFYTHLVLGHPGNPCTGSAVGIELLLPPGVQTANSANNPAFCFSVTASNQLINLDTDVDYGCPQSYPIGLQGLAVRALRGGIGGGAWGMARGFKLELLIPLRATQPYNGANAIAWRVNPDIGVVGYPQVSLYVNNDVIFRSAMEDNLLNLDVCSTNPRPNGC
ncbi:MAG: hypothetical protein JSR27_10805 [Proteobacteria bacterium]|nr:hypothetical protein [Pseudomonadota bacterium]